MGLLALIIRLEFGHFITELIQIALNCEHFLLDVFELQNALNFFETIFKIFKVVVAFARLAITHL